MTEFKINKKCKLIITNDDSITLQSCDYDLDLEGLDCDTIILTEEEARKLGQILIEELG